MLEEGATFFNSYVALKIASILTELLDRPPRREKLPTYNSFEDAVDLFRTRKRILILTGAGVSVSCGIPDFRSRDGIYARLHVDYPDLPDPTAMFDIRYFIHNPAPFYDFASEIFPGQFEPSISHKFIRQLEVNNQLLRNYTQNIDTLERQANIERVVECHGSFSKATCLNCSAKFDIDVIKDDVMAKRVAHCPRCAVGVIKPDIVFFGEDLGSDFHIQMAADKDEVDLLVVIGSSLKVRPVSLIPFSVDRNVPQILINREPLSSYRADIELLGNCDEIIEDICIALGGDFADLLERHRTCFGFILRGISYSRNSAKTTLAILQISQNRAIFPGAELYYDLETGAICQPMSHRYVIVVHYYFHHMNGLFSQFGVRELLAKPR
uniref:NAD-dependent protein deacetylase sir-2.1 n=1 Tax=Angiostrongylus cantonensis TaxID=6313 RepID=A0A0K0DCN7_ANGCA